jgi:hypothetical protein
LAALTCAKWMAPCGLTRFPGQLSPMKLADLSAVVPNRNTGLAGAGQGWAPGKRDIARDEKKGGGWVGKGNGLRGKCQPRRGYAMWDWGLESHSIFERGSRILVKKKSCCRIPLIHSMLRA